MQKDIRQLGSPGNADKSGLNKSSLSKSNASANAGKRRLTKSSASAHADKSSLTKSNADTDANKSSLSKSSADTGAYKSSLTKSSASAHANKSSLTKSNAGARKSSLTKSNAGARKSSLSKSNASAGAHKSSLTKKWLTIAVTLILMTCLLAVACQVAQANTLPDYLKGGGDATRILANFINGALSFIIYLLWGIWAIFSAIFTKELIMGADSEEIKTKAVKLAAAALVLLSITALPGLFAGFAS